VIDPNDYSIQGVLQRNDTKTWSKLKSRAFNQAVQGSSIANADWVDANGLHHASIFYQDPELRLREHSYDFSAGQWVAGESVLAIRPSIDDTHQIL